MLQIDQLIACLQSSVNQQGLLADKKREGRCPGDYFFFTVCVKHFSFGFIEDFDSKQKNVSERARITSVVGKNHRTKKSSGQHNS